MTILTSTLDSLTLFLIATGVIAMARGIQRHDPDEQHFGWSCLAAGIMACAAYNALTGRPAPGGATGPFCCLVRPAVVARPQAPHGA